jgi:hypothetical protein
VFRSLAEELTLVERTFAELAFENAETAMTGTAEDLRAALSNLEATAANLARALLRGSAGREGVRAPIE